MERNEMVEVLVSKANVSEEEALKALEICNWDMVDAVLYLERNKGGQKINMDKEVAVIDVEDFETKKEEDFGGIGEIVGKVFKFAGKIIKKGNEHYFVAKKQNERPIKITLTIAALLLIFLAIPTIIITVCGFFAGYKYSLEGKGVNYSGVNTVFDEMSKSADEVKRDFKKEYSK